MSRRLLVAVLVGCLFGSLCVTPMHAQELFVDPPRTETASDFVDLWVINGNAIGNALGAVVGQVAFTGLFGPGAWVVGSLVGGVSGGLIGDWVDNQVNRSFNYSAFNRPALGEPGALVLEDAGPMEQLLYQVDNWVLIGGNLSAFTVHFGLNALLRSIPGGASVLAPVALTLANYFAGIVGDYLDGMVDLAAIGARMDDARGLSPDSREASSSTSQAAEVASEGHARRSYRDDLPGPRELYEATRDAVRAEDGGTPVQREKLRDLWERYRDPRE